MPKSVSEVPDGNQFSRSSTEGQIADAAVRTFRILLNSPSEAFDIQSSCGVFIGQPHPVNSNITCTSFDAKYEGNTRMTLLATFQYASTPSASASSSTGGQDSKQISPEVRPASWSVSTELTEEPVRLWRLYYGDGGINAFDNAFGGLVQPTNVNGDRYEGLSILKPVSSIRFTQFVLGGSEDPTEHCAYVGMINRDRLQLGSLAILPHELMLRGVSSSPTVESCAGLVRRGWNVLYTFLLKKTTDSITKYTVNPFGEDIPPAEDIQVGWDMPVILEGRNVYCGFDPAAPEAHQDPYGLPLKKGDDDAILDPDNLELADGVAIGDIQRAHVKIGGFSARGTSQAPASEPVALNPDGTPRLVRDFHPIVHLHQVYEDFYMRDTLRLRID
jgi:hypothetical protein